MATRITKVVNSRNKASVNNGRRAPLQGFDTTVYIQDQGSGTLLPFGEFTGFQYTIRNATEPYLPLGHRNISLLDGEFQIGWVAEQGKINLEAVRDCLGFTFIGTVIRFSRSPRFQVVVEYNAPELDETSGVPGYVPNEVLSNGGSVGSATTQTNTIRSTVGRYVFGFCKIDAITSGVMAGRSVIADRIEGLAESWYYEPLDQGDAIYGKAYLDQSELSQQEANKFPAPGFISTTSRAATTPGIAVPALPTWAT